MTRAVGQDLYQGVENRNEKEPSTSHYMCLLLFFLLLLLWPDVPCFTLSSLITLFVEVNSSCLLSVLNLILSRVTAP